MSECVDQNLLTFILVAVCTPTYFKNPYLVSKLIEILFVINPAVQDRTQELYLRMISHPVAEEFLPSALMTFYTGKHYFISYLAIDVHDSAMRIIFSPCNYQKRHEITNKLHKTRLVMKGKAPFLFQGRSFALLQRVHVSLSHLDNIDFWLDFVVQMGKSPIGIVLFADFLVI